MKRSSLPADKANPRFIDAGVRQLHPETGSRVFVVLLFYKNHAPMLKESHRATPKHEFSFIYQVHIALNKRKKIFLVVRAIVFNVFKQVKIAIM